MASAANTQTINAEEVIFRAKDGNGDNDGPKCSSFFVSVRAASVNPVGINIPGLHKTGEFCGIQPGGTIIFRLFNMGIAKVFAKGLGGDALVDYGVVAQTLETG